LKEGRRFHEKERPLHSGCAEVIAKVCNSKKELRVARDARPKKERATSLREVINWEREILLEATKRKKRNVLKGEILQTGKNGEGSGVHGEGTKASGRGVLLSLFLSEDSRC